MTKPATRLELVKELTPSRPLRERLFSRRGLAAICPGITYGQIKNSVDHRTTNGLAEFDAIYRIHGNKFMIDAEAFDRWLESRVAER